MRLIRHADEIGKDFLPRETFFGLLSFRLIAAPFLQKRVGPFHASSGASACNQTGRVEMVLHFEKGK
jgi:hypothetical protein